MSANCQTDTVNGFKIENDEVIWQHIFKTNQTQEDLIKSIKMSGLLSDIKESEGTLSGNFSKMESEFKKAGYTETNTPIYVSRMFITGFAILEIKDNKYRVTLKKMVLTQKYTDALTKSGENETIEYCALKNDKSRFTNAFKKAPSIIYNFTFLQKFKFSTPQNDW